MNARKMMVSALTLSLIAGSSALAYAGQKGDCTGEHRIDKRLEHMTSALNLDQTQQAAVKELLTQRAEQRSAHKPGNRYSGLTALDPNAPDYQQQVQALIKEMQQNMAQRMQAHADHKAALYAILTPEQEQKLTEMRSERKHRRHHDGPRHHGY